MLLVCFGGWLGMRMSVGLMEIQCQEEVCLGGEAGLDVG
jgi:hypothetical protein